MSGSAAPQFYLTRSVSPTTTLLAGSSWPTLTLYFGLLFKCAAGISASSNADASSSFFWKVVVLQDGLLLLSLFTYLLVGAGGVKNGRTCQGTDPHDCGSSPSFAPRERQGGMLHPRVGQTSSYSTLSFALSTRYPLAYTNTSAQFEDRRIASGGPLARPS